MYNLYAGSKANPLKFLLQILFVFFIFLLIVIDFSNNSLEEFAYYIDYLTIFLLTYCSMTILTFLMTTV